MFIYFRLIIYLIFVLYTSEYQLDYIKVNENNGDTIPNTELKALQSLFESTSGYNWTWDGDGCKWNFTVPNNGAVNPCSCPWEGIQCTTSYPISIDSLSLDSNNLDGTIPITIGNLTALRTLTISNNPKLVGSIPKELGNISSLNSLTLTYNNLNGTIPHEIFFLSGLVELVVEGNVLTGTIPTQISNLNQLQYLYLSNNLFSQSLPLSIGLLANLRSFYIDTNRINGTIPTSLCNLTRLINIGFGYNNLSGTLPDCIGNMEELVDLNIYNNHLTGSIPLSLGNLSNSVQSINLDDNYLTGFIPNTIGNLTKLRSFTIGNNRICGTIPNELCLLPNLQYLDLSQNILNGTIPYNIGNLTSLQNVYFDSNYLTGSLPQSITNLTQLKQIFIFSNMLNGTIPTNIGNWKSIQSIDFSENLLSGSLPRSISNWTFVNYIQVEMNLFDGNLDIFNTNQLNLQQIIFSNNLFTGIIPLTICNLSVLSSIYLNNNHLSGTIPPCLVNNTILQDIQFQSNHLHGTIPTNIYKLYNLFTFYISFNYITGTIPLQLYKLENTSSFAINSNYLYGSIDPILEIPHLFGLNLSSNLFSGTISDYITNLTDLIFIDFSNNHLNGFLPQKINNFYQLIYMNLSSNYLSGTIPHTISQLYNITTLDISTNLFTGTIPTNMSTLINVQLLFLQNNHLFGSIDNLVNSSYQYHISHIDISNNRLSGTIPNEPFFLRELSTFAAVKNCFTGTLPSEICQAPNLTVLAFDGLSSSPNCQIPLLISKSTYIKRSNSITGEVPSCLFTMPNLMILHLSGNTLISSLPHHIIEISSSLQDLSLSHNLLTGIIPSQFQQKQWRNLDLSFNLFNGELLSSFATINPNSSINLELNRLSGKIPSTMRYVKSVSVLDGNIFECDYLNPDNSLPIHDDYYKKYTCGSDSWEATIYIWIIIIMGEIMIFSLVIGNLFIVLMMNIAYVFATLYLKVLDLIIVTTAMIDTNCFYFTLIPPPSVSTSYTYSNCIFGASVDGQLTCQLITTFTNFTNYIPPFLYTYQCSSTLMTNYIPIYIQLNLKALLVDAPYHANNNKISEIESPIYNRDSSIIMEIGNSNIEEKLIDSTLSIIEFDNNDKHIDNKIFLENNKYNHNSVLHSDNNKNNNDNNNNNNRANNGCFIALISLLLVNPIESFSTCSSQTAITTRFSLLMAGGRSKAEEKLTSKMMFKQIRDKLNTAAKIPGFLEVGDGIADIELFCKSNRDGTQIGDCPFTQFIQLVLLKKGLKYAIRPTLPSEKPAWLLEKHEGKLPALVHKGESLIDSMAIAEYIEKTFPYNSLTRQGAYSYQEVLEKTSDFLPSLSTLIKNKDEEKDAGLLEKVNQQLDLLDEILRSTPGQYLCGIELTLADLYLLPQLFHAMVTLDHFKDVEFYHINGEPTRPALENYMARMLDMEEFNSKQAYYNVDQVVFGWKVARGDITL
eukprot:gene4695-6593_t